VQCLHFILIAMLGLSALCPNSVLAESRAGVQPPAAEEPLTVYVTVGLLDLDGINSAEQNFTVNLYAEFRWLDPNLAHPGPGHIRKSLSDIAAPRFLLLNKQRTWSSLINVVDISPEGEAIYRMRQWGDFSQPLKLQKFPFDSHSFEIPVLAIPSTDREVRLAADPTQESFMMQELSVADWQVSGWSAEVRAIAITDRESVDGFVFSINAQRIYTHHLVKFIVPLILIVAMSWVVFWIDPKESGSQLSVAVTAVLTLIAYHIALTNQLPDIPYLTRMDLFLFCSTLLVFLSLIEVVLTSHLATIGRLKLARRVDQVSRLLFLAAYIAVASWSLTKY
jgi:hypothetical protein